MNFEAAYDPHLAQQRTHLAQGRALAAQAQQETRGNPVHQELAQRLHALFASQAQSDGLEKLKALVASSEAGGLPPKVKSAFDQAKAKPTFSNLQRLEREYTQHQESEETMLLMTLATLED